MTERRERAPRPDPSLEAMRKRANPPQADHAWLAERREILDALVMPEVVAEIQKRWPEGTATLAYGSVGMPVLEQGSDKERRVVRWIVKVRKHGDLSRPADFEITWPHDIEPDAAVEALPGQIWKQR